MSSEIKVTKPKIVLSLDVGTTTIRAIAITKDGTILGRCQAKVRSKYNFI